MEQVTAAASLSIECSASASEMPVQQAKDIKLSLHFRDSDKQADQAASGRAVRHELKQEEQVPCAGSVRL